jgi:pimeloyl-ACP methyl ester carboxylesterase
MWTNIEQTAYAYTGGKPFNSSQPCVVLLHGAQNDHSVWALQSRWLAHHGFSVLAFDLPAHGRSASPALTSVEGMADWVLLQTQQLGIQQFHVAGHSMGSLMALDIALRSQASLKSLALLATAAPMPVSKTLIEQTELDPYSAIDQINVWSHLPSIQGYTSTQPGSNFLASNQRLMQRVAQQHGGHVLSNDFHACNNYPIDLQQLPSITIPTLIATGLNDSMTPPKSATQLSKHIQNAQLLLLPQCGHALMSEQADTVRQSLFTHFSNAERLLKPQ